MGKRDEAARLKMYEALRAHGVSVDDFIALRQISVTLHRWHELECGDGHGHIERDEQTGVTRYHNDEARYLDPHDPRAWRVIADRETGARKRLAKIMSKYPTLGYYVQGDPRGCALYILRPGDVPEGESADAYYSRGVAIY